MKVLVCGDRFWNKDFPIQRRLSGLPDGALVITGGAEGVDTIAHKLASDFGFLTAVIYAHWKHRNLPESGHCHICDQPACPPDCQEISGHPAGPIRNKKMLALAPDLVIAFHDDIFSSKGTRNCLTQAIRRGIPCELWTSRSPSPVLPPWPGVPTFL